MLQIRRGSRDNLGIILMFLHKNIYCDPTLELSREDSSFEGYNVYFVEKQEKNLQIILVTCPCLEPCHLVIK